MYAKAVVTCFVTTLILLGLSIKAYSIVSRVTAVTDDGIILLLDGEDGDRLRPGNGDPDHTNVDGVSCI